MNEPIKIDQETGLTINKSYLLNSGFNAVEGGRQFGQLTIKEGVLKGVATNLLTSIKVFDEQGVLIIDLCFDRMTSYSRERVRKIILDALIQMLMEVASLQGKKMDIAKAYDLLDHDLKMVYFEQSYASIAKLAESWGLTLN